MTYSILIADDEQNAREGLRRALEEEDRRVDTAYDGADAWEKLQKSSYDILITDVRMPGMDGMSLLEEAKKKDPKLEVIMLTAYGSIEMAVDAMKKGAFHYITKPINLDEVEVLLERVIEKKRIEYENEYHRETARSAPALSGIVGKSKAIQHLTELIKQIAPTKATVLITGETGTGKELVARAIHELSPRKDRLFVPIHCAALAENLLESELFGHERGAFTGAVKQRKGRFEIANQGTLFLDEISEIDPGVQVKLLRVLQEKQFERVGGTETIKVDIRIVAATNRDLQQLVDEGSFREDLYYRLRVVSIHVPALRERKEDIPLLTDHFVNHFAREYGKEPPTVSPEVIRIFQQYEWPGNVRELQGVLESMVILARGPQLEKNNIPLEIRNESENEENELPAIEAGDATLADIEKRVILETLEKFDGNRTRTAEALGIGRRTLIRKLHEYGVSKSGEEGE